jgi:hypothetical protein
MGSPPVELNESRFVSTGAEMTSGSGFFPANTVSAEMKTSAAAKSFFIAAG